MGMNDTFSYWAYQSDDGTTYTVKLSTDNAAAGGFVAAEDLNTVWAGNTKNLRHVLLRDDDGHRTRLPVSNRDNTLFVNGGTVNLRGRSYQVMGRVGEKRLLSAIGG